MQFKLTPRQIQRIEKELNKSNIIEVKVERNQVVLIQVLRRLVPDEK
ncbi:hypothetical protein [Solobacterium moorei]|jgi:hypothetical protein|nr:hypothetical protein [Solobacterium moorei]BET21251.1 hypothetical protein RGT18_08390 [Solobacterium moorei]